MKAFLGIAALLAALAMPLAGSEATFSLDGGYVYCATGEQPTLTVIDLGTLAASRIDLSDFIGPQEIRAVTLSKSGNVLFATPWQVWEFDPRRHGCVKLCDAEEDMEFADLAFNPKDEYILISTLEIESTSSIARSFGAMILERGARVPGRIVLKRIERLDGMAFDGKGTLYFGAGGDLWVGTIYDATDLDAWRFAPLATSETYPGTPSQMGVRAVAIAGEQVYAYVRRMGGSGDACIVRVDMPPSDPGNWNDVTVRLNVYRRALATAKVIDFGSCYTCGLLCARRDGKRVFYRCGIVEPDGKVRKICIMFPD